MSFTALPAQRAPGVEVMLADGVADIDGEWDALLARCVSTPYQRREFVDLWTRHASAGHRQSARIGVVREQGRAVVILPLGIEVRYGVTVGSYLGASHSNLNMPVVDPQFAARLDAPLVRAMLRDYCRAAGADVLILENQPAEWLGRRHPFAALRRQEAIDPVLRLECDSTYEDYVARHLSREARSKIKRKARSIVDAGARLLVARQPDEIERLLASFLRQKRQRLAQMGVDDPFAAEGVVEFLRQLALRGEQGLELIGLVDDEAVHAVAGWVRDGEQASIMLLSFDPASRLTRFSPGDVLLSQMFGSRLGTQLRHIDFGLGIERYKATWANAQTALFNTTCSATMRGALYAAGHRQRTALLREIKRNRGLYQIVRRIRARFAGRSSGAE